MLNLNENKIEYISKSIIYNKIYSNINLNFILQFLSNI